MGRLIVLEGLDGCGKSTQFRLLNDACRAHGINVKGISFPDYNDESSALVRMYLRGDFGDSADSVNAYAASSFYSVDRYASYRRYWQEDYENGVGIIAARYVTSNMLHQMSKLDRSKWSEYIDWLTDFEYEKLGLPRPDTVFLFDMPIEVSQRLLAERYGGDEGKKDIHERSTSYLESCRRAAVYAAEKFGWRVVKCCDQNGVLRAADSIHNEIFSLAVEILKN